MEKVEIKIITPQEAEKLLSIPVPQRKVSQALVDNYASEIRRGFFKVTNQGIGLNLDGGVIDGRHRLHAIIQTGIACKMVVVSGLEQEVQSLIDVGKMRRLSDYLSFEGENYTVARIGIVNALLRNITGVTKTTKLSCSRFKEISSLYQKEIDSTLRLSAAAASVIKLNSVLAALVFAKKADYDSVELFEMVYFSGENLAKDNPALTLRNFLLTRRYKKEGDYRISLFIKTLNALRYYINGQKLEVLKWSDDALPYFSKYQREYIEKIKSLV